MIAVPPNNGGMSHITLPMRVPPKAGFLFEIPSNKNYSGFSVIQHPSLISDLFKKYLWLK